MKPYISIIFSLLSCLLMAIVYVLYLLNPVPGNYSTAYIILYKTTVQLVDMIPFILLVVVSLIQKKETHRFDRSLPLYALAVKFFIDSVAGLLYSMRLVKNLTFMALAEDRIWGILFLELLLALIAWTFQGKVFIVANVLYLMIFSVFSYDVLHAEPTPLRIIWGIANFIWYLSLIPLAETMTLGNTYSNVYLKTINHFRLKRGLELIESDYGEDTDESFVDTDDSEAQ